ncbi:chemotaxis protein CheX [Aquibacillus koreensis]|uniref:Chemotaxis protein CheX n=1 Tax=Aquibacillus koreensis TaxID=279446 RepID=A0A9X4AJH5_9BACI|nr:chemotaxis protein CheX [Aquibacillus koreensis]MCT2535959.1 chemotaxis protein CheX [Aquibacillus koreensis]MDC3420415.1 chemotaxis protein CheX [Aquibacillus koreensis]
MTTNQSLTANQVVKEFYNGLIHSVHTVIPVEHAVGSPSIIKSSVEIPFGVSIHFTGDLIGELVFKANVRLFSDLGEAMFGMALSEEMIDSFSGELGNMLAGSLSTHLSSKQINTNISHPVVQRSTLIPHAQRSILTPITFSSLGDMEIFLLVNA